MKKESSFKIFHQGVKVVTLADPDFRGGKSHEYTPDIIVSYRGRKIVVEVDPIMWHGGGKKIEDDFKRHMNYYMLGYGVVRIRIGGLKKIGPDDIVIPSSSWSDTYAQRLIRSIKKSKPALPYLLKNSRKIFHQNMKVKKSKYRTR